MIKNLAQLKRVLNDHPRLEIIGHCRPECIGQIRRVTLANTQGFYSIVDGQPEHKISQGNNGLGAILFWGKAASWCFEGTTCRVYDCNAEHTPKHLIMAFRVLDAA